MTSRQKCKRSRHDNARSERENALAPSVLSHDLFQIYRREPKLASAAGGTLVGTGNRRRGRRVRCRRTWIELARGCRVKREDLHIRRALYVRFDQELL